ncbi:MAG: alpha/beta fold hydrolase [Cellvibrionales bacterium]|nr:alpha/beta fold hydrolase [Porticoccaceae bacterium]
MKLNYSRRGEGSSVVLMHGMFGSQGNLGTVARALSENFNTLSLDLRNHGGSPHDPMMSLETMAEDLIETLDSLAIDRVALLGHSLGGKVAMQAALTYPERIAKLVVADIAPVSYTQSHNPILDALRVLDESVIRGRKQADDILARYEGDAGVRGFLLQNLLRVDGGEYRLRLNVAAISTHYFHGLMAAPEGQPYKQPVLFIKGQMSAYIQDKHRENMRRMFPASTVEVIDGAGHWLHSEKPSEFNQMATDFMLDPDTRGSSTW